MAGAVVYAALLEVTTPKVALLIQLVVPVMLAVRYVSCIIVFVCSLVVCQPVCDIVNDDRILTYRMHQGHLTLTSIYNHAVMCLSHCVVTSSFLLSGQRSSHYRGRIVYTPLLNS